MLADCVTWNSVKTHAETLYSDIRIYNFIRLMTYACTRFLLLEREREAMVGFFLNYCYYGDFFLKLM